MPAFARQDGAAAFRCRGAPALREHALAAAALGRDRQGAAATAARRVQHLERGVPGRRIEPGRRVIDCELGTIETGRFAPGAAGARGVREASLRLRREPAGEPGFDGGV
jgi:hypothetical protein